MGRWKKLAVPALACAAAFLSFAGLNAVTSSRLYRILISEQVSVGNTALKTGAGYSLFGTTGQLGYGSLAGAQYSVNWGTVNSWRPPQGDVSAAHAFPNPCSLKAGCDHVTFTRLTLKAVIRIYTVSGELVQTITKDSNSDSSETWYLKNAAGRQLASGLYLYLIQGEGAVKKGKLVIIR